MTSNSLFVNQNVNSIQDAITNADAPDVIYVSSGSYDAPVVINNVNNIALQAPNVGNTICEILQPLTISGTSESIRLTNFSIKGTTTISNTGRNYFQKCSWTGVATSINSNTKYMTFENCEWDSNSSITIGSGVSERIYFINCNFLNATITFNNLSSLVVIFSNCAGFRFFPSLDKATLVGMNVLTSGVSQLSTTTINGGGSSDAGYVLTANSGSAPTFQPLPTVSIPNTLTSRLMENRQQTSTSSAVFPNYLVLYSENLLETFTPFYENYFKFVVNFDSSAKSTVSFQIVIDGDTSVPARTVEVANGHNCIPITFSNTNGVSTNHSVELRVSPTDNNHTVSFTTSSYLSFEVQQVSRP